MAVRPAELVYAVDEWPPLPRLAGLGLQYAVLVSVYLVMVVITAQAARVSGEVAADLVSLGLVACAIGMAVQAWNGRFFGSGFLAPPSFSALYLGPAVLAAKAGGLPAVAGMVVFAGLVEIVFAHLLRHLRVVLQPLVTGFIIFVVGIELGLLAITHVLDVSGVDSPDFRWRVAVGTFTFAVAAGLSVWGRGAFRLMAALIGLAAGIAAGAATGVIGPAGTAAAAAEPWFALPDPSILSYAFDPALVPAFLTAAFAAALRTAGVLTTAERINDAAWRKADPDNLRRGIVGDGLGTVAAGILGCPGMSVTPSMVAMSGATGATSRVIAFAAALILLALAFVPKFAATVIALPIEIIGGVLVFTSSFLIAGGITLMASREIDLRNSFAVSIALLLGLMSVVQPSYFALLPAPLHAFTGNMMTVAIVSLLVLILVFRIAIRRRDTLVWQGTESPVRAFGDLLDRDARNWKLRAGALGPVKATVEAVLGRLADADLIREPARISAAYDEIEILVEIAYRGRPLPLPSTSHGEAGEEAATVEGMRHHGHGIEADRALVSVSGDLVTLRLWFAA